MNFKYINRKHFIINFIYFFLILACSFLIIKYLLPIFLPVIIGASIAYLSKKTADKFSKNKFFGIVSIFLFWIIITLIFYLVFWGIIFAISYMARSFPLIKNDITNTFTYLNDKYATLISTSSPFFNEIITSSKTAIFNFIINITLKFGAFLANFITYIPNIILYIIVTIMTSFLIFIEYDKIIQFLSKSKFFNSIKKAKNFSYVTFFNVVKAQSILFLIVYILLCIGLFILNIKFAFIIALFIALIDLLPLIGLNFVMGVWGSALILKGNISLGILIILLSFVIFLIKQFIEPKIVSSKIGISPLVVLLGAYFGFILFGITGLLLAPFAISFAKIYFLKE